LLRIIPQKPLLRGAWVCGSPFSAPEFDGKNVEQVQHLPSQQKNRKQNYNDGHQFSEAETSSRRFEAPCRQT
jgi:hypothetical protein